MGIGGMGGMGKMMNQLKKMQTQIAELQERAGTIVASASAGGGMVEAVANGKQELIKIEIQKEAVNPEDVEMLQDMIIVAVNESLKKAQAAVNDEMSKITGGVKIPGLF